MNAFEWIWKAAVAWVALMIATIIAGVAVPIKAPVVPHQFGWWLFSSFLVVAAMGFAAMRAEWRGWRLGAAMVTVPLVNQLASAIEGSVFLGHTPIPWTRLLLNAVVAYALALPVWGMIFSMRRGAPEGNYRPFASKAVGERVWKYAVSTVSYLFLYYLAGSIIFPFVRDYYATQTLPSGRTVIALQLLVRGPVLVALCLLLLRMVGMTRWVSALAVGLIFTMVTGVAPLLIPNPFFPDAVRWVHFGEVVSENFVFGAFVGWLWGEAKKAGVAVMQAA